jgi:hypothetical protein
MVAGRAEILQPNGLTHTSPGQPRLVGGRPGVQKPVGLPLPSAEPLNLPESLASAREAVPLRSLIQAPIYLEPVPRPSFQRI